MTTGDQELNIRELAAEIGGEVEMAARHHDLSEEFEVGTVRFHVDTEAVADMLRNEHHGFDHALSIMMAVLARHCEKTLVNCEEMPVKPLPNKHLDRFGPDADSDGDVPEN